MKCEGLSSQRIFYILEKVQALIWVSIEVTHFYCKDWDRVKGFFCKLHIAKDVEKQCMEQFEWNEYHL